MVQPNLFNQCFFERYWTAGQSVGVRLRELADIRPLNPLPGTCTDYSNFLEPIQFFASLSIQYREITHKKVFTTKGQHWQNVTFWSFFFIKLKCSNQSHFQVNFKFKSWRFEKYIYLYTPTYFGTILPHQCFFFK